MLAPGEGDARRARALSSGDVAAFGSSPVPQGIADEFKFNEESEWLVYYVLLIHISCCSLFLLLLFVCMPQLLGHQNGFLLIKPQSFKLPTPERYETDIAPM